MSTQNIREKVSVRLSTYQQCHRNTLYRFYLPDDQLLFTRMPINALPIALEDQHRHPVVILANEVPIGFFILYDGQERTDYTNNRSSLILRALSINYKDQNKGYAKMALLQLREYVKDHFSEIEEVALAVNARNVVAINLYRKCGFVDEGRTRMGPKGIQHLLSLSL
ncbi:GNAT family N-acetyltransferase [Bacillus salitolerans]|uniref:GNAT family N-acetyltransferase n=1 Tax=Bacillus salitolerans TaxID=1437434 RepID=A0ABW4LR56_9BACI